EVAIAVLEDLAELRLDEADADGAIPLLTEAGRLLTGDLVFGWRLRLKHDLIASRLALMQGNAERALSTAGRLPGSATAVGVPRYISAARILGHRARAALGMPVDLAKIDADLDLLQQSIAIEAWWWTGDLAADLGIPGWLDRAERLADLLAAEAGQHADSLRRDADNRLRNWRRVIG